MPTTKRLEKSKIEAAPSQLQSTLLPQASNRKATPAEDLKPTGKSRAFHSDGIEAAGRSLGRLLYDLER